MVQENLGFYNESCKLLPDPDFINLYYLIFAVHVNEIF